MPKRMTIPVPEPTQAIYQFSTRIEGDTVQFTCDTCADGLYLDRDDMLRHGAKVHPGALARGSGRGLVTRPPAPEPVKATVKRKAPARKRPIPRGGIHRTAAELEAWEELKRHGNAR